MLMQVKDKVLHFSVGSQARYIKVKGSLSPVFFYIAITYCLKSGKNAYFYSYLAVVLPNFAMF